MSSEQAKRQQLAIYRLQNAATFAQATLDKLGIIQDSLYSIGEDDAAAEIDDLIDLQNVVWITLGRIHQDVKSESQVTI